MCSLADRQFLSVEIKAISPTENWLTPAYTLRVRALAAYKDFLTLWKDADPDMPILKQAKAEYAKLQ